MLRRTFLAGAIALPAIALAFPATAQMTPPPAIAPVSTGVAPVGEAGIYYEVFGEGPTLLLLHGAYTSINLNWGAVIPALAEHHQVIAIDAQGHGHTADVPGRPITYEGMADDAAGVLQHLGIATADVLGYSLGGGAALQLAIRHPEMVSRLIVASAGYSSDGYHPEILAGIEMLTPEMFAGTPLEADYMATAPNPADWPVLMEKLKALDAAPFDWSADVAAITAETLLIFGDADALRVPHIAEMFLLMGGGVAGDYAGIPRVRLAVLPGTTHVGVMMQPDLLLAIVEPFLAGEAPATP
ncbi:MAG: alpha/beta fold hydrolase [Bauldia sp.]|nr:alpha/beta fold hydrolase [Bauldia sp.]